MWDTDIDVEAFRNRFFKAWYGPAAKEMLAYYDSYNSHMKSLKEKHQYFPYNPTVSQYPKNLLNEWLENIDAALASIESMQTSNSKRYNTLKRRIEAEEIAIRYCFLTVHEEDYTEAELIEARLAFKEDTQRLGFELKSLYKTWGIA